ncbi:hypothetical protein [Aeromonas salmonicida]|uniref:hypothetical protein n=1 Tax=Aeromonas salmonicida TaxID=645 RepID=UPI003D194769
MAIAPKTKSAITGIGTRVFINFDGHGKTATEITQELPEVSEVGATTISREIKTATKLSGEELAAAGSVKYSDQEVKFILNTASTPMYKQLQAAISADDKCDVSMRVVYPTGQELTGNYTIYDLGQPPMGDEIISISAKFKPSGKPAFKDVV